MVDYILKDTYGQRRFSKDTLSLHVSFTLCLLYFYKKGLKEYFFLSTFVIWKESILNTARLL